LDGDLVVRRLYENKDSPDLWWSLKKKKKKKKDTNKPNKINQIKSFLADFFAFLSWVKQDMLVIRTTMFVNSAVCRLSAIS
jgi:hypothetical protein